MIREYLLSVTATAVASSLTCSFADHIGGTAAKIIKMLCGIFISLVILGPLIQFDLSEIDLNLRDYTLEANSISSKAEADLSKQQRTVIKDQLEAYVYGKATDLGCSLSVSVDLSEDPPYAPERIYLDGKVSPYAKMKLKEIITSDLGIHAEAQTWSN